LSWGGGTQSTGETEKKESKIEECPHREECATVYKIPNTEKWVLFQDRSLTLMGKARFDSCAKKAEYSRCSTGKIWVVGNSRVQHRKMTPFLVALLGYNSPTIKFTHLKCTLQWVLVYSEWYNYQHYLILEHFHFLPHHEIPYLLVTPAPSTSSSKQPLTNFLPPHICLSWMFYIRGIVQYVLFCDCVLSFSIFSRSIHTVAWVQYFIPFYCQIILNSLHT
jgi:hypothetical protein